MTQWVNKGVRVQNKAVWLSSSLYVLFTTAIFLPLKEREKCVWLEWHGGPSWSYHRLWMEGPGQANSLTQVNCRVRGPGERTWMMHLDTARRAAIQKCGAEKSSINCLRTVSCNWTFLRSGNYGRVQRFGSSLVGNQEGILKCIKLSSSVFKWGKIIGLTLILNFQV